MESYESIDLFLEGQFNKNKKQDFPNKIIVINNSYLKIDEHFYKKFDKLYEFRVRIRNHVKLINVIKSIRNKMHPTNTTWINITYEIGYFDCNAGEVTKFIISNEKPKEVEFI